MIKKPSLDTCNSVHKLITQRKRIITCVPLARNIIKQNWHKIFTCRVDPKSRPGKTNFPLSPILSAFPKMTRSKCDKFPSRPFSRSPTQTKLETPKSVLARAKHKKLTTKVRCGNKFFFFGSWSRAQPSPPKKKKRFCSVGSSADIYLRRSLQVLELWELLLMGGGPLVCRAMLPTTQLIIFFGVGSFHLLVLGTFFKRQGTFITFSTLASSHT